MHTTIMSDRLALDLGIAENRENPVDKRDCNHCGYNIPSGETVFVESWCPIAVLKKENQTPYLQWNVYHPFCVAQKALFTVSKTLRNFQRIEDDPKYEGEIA